MPGRADDEARSNLILTVGHSTSTFKEFLGLLRAHGVRHPVDVRRFPHSLRRPHVDRVALSKRLTPRRRDKLPTRAGPGRLQAPPRPVSPNAGWRNSSFRGYADHTAISDFRTDFERMVGLCGGEERACLMCSEAVWWRYLRRMIADALLVRGFSVEHILDEHRRTAHTLTPWAEVVRRTELVYPPYRSRCRSPPSPSSAPSRTAVEPGGSPNSSASSGRSILTSYLPVLFTWRQRIFQTPSPAPWPHHPVQGQAPPARL
jgi:uncharacterized protein DUF488